MRSGIARACLAALAASLLVVAAAAAITAKDRTTRVASPPPESGPPANAASGNAAFSGDGRGARYMAFDSEATNLVANDTNGGRDVFVIVRGTRTGRLHGRVQRVSLAGRGGQANGHSWNPSVDGDTRHRPRCVAFQSTSTNLSRGDRSADSDVYVRDLRRRRTELASPGRRSAQNPVIDGECETVTFESRGKVYVRDLVKNRTLTIARGRNPDQQTNGKGVAYERGSQVYYRAFTRKRGKIVRRGREVLVSATRSGRRGNGRSADPSIDDSGHYVAFESTATNLCTRTCKGVSKDRNGRTSDVFRRTLSRKAPTRDRMQMVSYSYAVRAQGNGPSYDPAMSGAGENILFVSEATNLRESRGIKERTTDPNGTQADVYYWNFPRKRRQGNVSRVSRTNAARDTGQAWPAPALDPAISNKANYIAWTSAAAGPEGLRAAPFDNVFIRFLGGK